MSFAHLVYTNKLHSKLGHILLYSMWWIRGTVTSTSFELYAVNTCTYCKINCNDWYVTRIGPQLSCAWKKDLKEKKFYFPIIGVSSWCNEVFISKLIPTTDVAHQIDPQPATVRERNDDSIGINYPEAKSILWCNTVEIYKKKRPISRRLPPKYSTISSFSFPVVLRRFFPLDFFFLTRNNSQIILIPPFGLFSSFSFFFFLLHRFFVNLQMYGINNTINKIFERLYEMYIKIINFRFIFSYLKKYSIWISTCFF